MARVVTIQRWNPQLAHPVWVKIENPRVNKHSVGDEYDVRLMETEVDNDGKYTEIHKAQLISKEVMQLGDVPNYALTLATNEHEKEEVLDAVSPSEDNWSWDKEVKLLVFARVDAVKELVTGEDSIEPEYNREDYLSREYLNMVD